MLLRAQGAVIQVERYSVRSPRRLTIAVWVIVVAVIGGTAGVWWEPLHDLVMYRADTTYFANGELRWKYYRKRWAESEWVVKGRCWRESGRLHASLRDGAYRVWNESGSLIAAFTGPADGQDSPTTGVWIGLTSSEPLTKQTVMINGVAVHTVSSAPWLSEEQIERALEGRWP